MCCPRLQKNRKKKAGRAQGSPAKTKDEPREKAQERAMERPGEWGRAQENPVGPKKAESDKLIKTILFAIEAGEGRALHAQETTDHHGSV